MQDTYGCIENVKIITLAPEVPNVIEAIPDLVNKGIVVSVGLYLFVLSHSPVEPFFYGSQHFLWQPHMEI